MPDYYLVQVSDNKAVAGPFGSPYVVASLVDAQEKPTDYGSASRWQLAKIGKYPQNKAGETQLKADVEASGKYKRLHLGYPIVFCKHCGGSMHYRMYTGWWHDMDLSTDGASFLPNGDICGKAEPASS